MKINRFVDAIAGNEHSKAELTLAYRKARKLGWFTTLSIFVIGTVISFICFPINSSPYFADALFFDIADKLLIPLILASFIGVLVGSQAFRIFTKHIKITLPESIAPRVETKSR